MLLDGAPCLVLGRELLALDAGGLRGAYARPAGATAALITPPSLVAVLGAGWEPVVPLLHPTA